MKKVIVAILMTIVLIFSLTGCGEIKKAENTVSQMFEAFQDLNFEEAKNYVDMEGIAATDDPEATKMFMEHIFDRLDYKILSSEKIDSNTVYVTTEITMLDMKPVLQEYLTAAIQYAFANAFAENPPTEEETEAKMEELFIESASKEGLETVTNEVVIEVVCTDDVWKVVSDDEFADALLGGMVSAMEEIEASMAEAEDDITEGSEE